MIDKKSEFETNVMVYLLTCGIISDDDINKICKYYEINISEKEKKKILKEMDLFYDQKCYSKYDFPEMQNLYKERNENDITLRLLTREEIINYTLYLGVLLEKIEEIVKSPTSELVFIMANILRIFDDDIYGCKLIEDKKRINLFKGVGIGKKDLKKLVDVFDEYGDKLRYWMAYGRDDYDIDFYNVIEDIKLVKKPTDETLINCLNNLDKDGYENIEATYIFEEKSKEELKDVIIETFKESVKYFNKSEYDNFINCNHKEITYAFTEDDFVQGYVFAYEEDGVIKTLVPKEIMDVLKSVNVNELENYNEEDEFSSQIVSNFYDKLDTYIDDVVLGYLEMNGVIKKKVLQNLLKENHGLDMDLKELDDIVKEFGSHLVHKDYYSVVNDDKIIKSLLKIKSDDYRKCTPEVCNIIDDYFYEINKLCDGNEELEYNINTIVRLGGMNKNNMEYIKDEFNLSKSVSNKIYETVNKYKNKLPLWPCNGYNNLNNNVTVKNEKKIGRNEPCPCGSGKKYKKCCGR